jgi:hypothetical protein
MFGERLSKKRTVIAVGVVIFIGAMEPEGVSASNHLDTPEVQANPQANIGDMYAWMAPDGQHLNLVMDIVGHSFSDKLSYVFHIDSGPRFDHTTATTTVVCRFPEGSIADCQLGNIDRLKGVASGLSGINGKNHRFRVFAGLRDDPFFNNVKGTLAAYQVALDALKGGAARDPAGCPVFDAPTARSILYQWRHTEGGPAANLLAHWTTSALVISVDVNAVNRGGKMLAVWSDTETRARRLDRVGRPLSKNALVGLTDPAHRDRMKVAWNRATPATSRVFVTDLERSLAFYDGLDGVCGNQFLTEKATDLIHRYRPLALLLADDRLWVNSASRTCTQLFAVELAELGGETVLGDETVMRNDCGGRTLTYNASNTWRSLLVSGTVTGIDDGLDHDEHAPSRDFPFLVSPDEQAVNHYGHDATYSD